MCVLSVVLLRSFNCQGTTEVGDNAVFAFQLILSVDSVGRSSMRQFRSSRAGR